MTRGKLLGAKETGAHVVLPIWMTLMTRLWREQA